MSHENSEAYGSIHIQEEAFKMRKAFTDYLSKNFVGNHCLIQFNCREKTQVEAKLEIFNSQLDTFGCSALQTPMSTVDHALLRASDVAFIEVKTQPDETD